MGEPQAAEEPERLAPGTILEDRYRILGELGEGGIGWVYRAEHVKLKTPVAIKMLQPQYAHHEQMRPRFEREAKALASLSHPNIVTLTDFSVTEGRPYLVMELLEGRGLDVLLAEGPLDEPITRHIAAQVIDALVYAHERGFVHRDLKPANIFLCALPTDPHHVKLLDFGFVKLVADESESPQSVLTQSGIAFGTPSYMSPEQATGDVVDARADLYAFGVVLFEMLAARRPFVGSLPEIVRQHLTTPPPPLSVGGRAIDASPALREVLARALAKEREDRFDHAEAMRAAMRAMPVPWTVPGIGEHATLLAVPGNDDVGSAETVAARPAAKSESSSPKPAAPSLERAALGEATPAAPPRPSEVGAPPSRTSSTLGLGFGLLLIAALSGAAVWYFGIRPSEVAELGTNALQGALTAEGPRAAPAEPEPEDEDAPLPEQGEGDEQLASLLDEISGEWWAEDETDSLSTDEALEEEALEEEALEGDAEEEVLEDEPLEEDAEEEALGGDTEEEALEGDAEEEELLEAEALEEDAAEEAVAAEALADAREATPAQPVEIAAAATDAEDGPDESADAEADDAEEDDAEEDDAPLGPNPWRVRPVVPRLVRARRIVLDGRALTRDQKRALRELVRADRADPRPHLVLAQSFVAGGQHTSAVQRYDLAHRVDGSARGDPRMLFDLVRLATEGDAQRDAAAMLERVYGEDALLLVDELVEDDDLSAERRASLRALRARLAGDDTATRPRTRARRRGATTRRRARTSRRSRARSRRSTARRRARARARRARARRRRARRR